MASSPTYTVIAVLEMNVALAMPPQAPKYEAAAAATMMIGFASRINISIILEVFASLVRYLLRFLDKVWQTCQQEMPELARRLSMDGNVPGAA